AARDMLALGQPQARLYPLQLGPELAQCCGGRADVLVELFDQKSLQLVKEFALLEEKSCFMTLGELSDSGVRRTVKPVSDVQSRPACTVMLNDGQLIEWFGLRVPILHLYGAGHVARALVQALLPLEMIVHWFDSRDHAFPNLVPSNVTTHRLTDPAFQFDQSPDHPYDWPDYVLVMTHSHELDYKLVESALTHKAGLWVGLIGSQTKRKRFEHRLKRSGARVLGRLICPIGTGKLNARNPAAIALDVAWQLAHLQESVEAESLNQKACTNA
ncbi:MAG: xanthine dehydrogenase accessory protein XdhC, partial [Pseudomonadota bacterium]